MNEIKFTGPYQQLFDRPDEEIVIGLREGRWPESFVPAALNVLQYRREQRILKQLHTLGKFTSITITLLIVVGVLLGCVILGIDDLLLPYLSR